MISDRELKHKVVFRVDTNKHVGLGHIKRCWALAAQFQQDGHQVLLAGAIDESFPNQFRDSHVPYQCLEARTHSPEDLSNFLAVCRRFDAEMIVMDVYGMDQEYGRRVMEEGYFLIAMHDTGMPTQAAHMIINGNLNAQMIPYHTSAEVTLLLGIDYLMMSPEYGNLQALKGQGQDSGTVKNILITMGGVDQYDLTTRILCILNDIPADFTITVIAGPYYENQETIVQQIKRMKKPVDLVLSPPSLFLYIKNCSLAISSAGQTLYQLAALGRSTIGIALEENQIGHLKELSKRGALIDLIYQEGKVFEEDLKNRISEMITDSSQRIRLAESAAKLVDGQGAHRAFKAIVHTYRSRREKHV